MKTLRGPRQPGGLHASSIFAAFCLLALATGAATAGLHEGKAAYERANYPMALRELRPLAEQGDAYAQSRLGTMYLGGMGVAHDADAAHKWLRRAADQGDAQAQGWLGFMVLRGLGVARNTAEGLRLVRMAADRGDPYAPLTMAWAYRHGQGVAKNEAEERSWLGKAAEAIRKAAEQGSATAQYALAGTYAKGHGVAIDDAEAVNWLRKAVDQGHASAQFSMGVAHGTGSKPAGNAAEELKQLRLATDQSDIAMQVLLGVLFAQGNALARDDAQALGWYRKAAEQGHAEAWTRMAALQRKLASATPGAAPSDPSLRAYRHPVYRWTLSYPSDWTLDAANTADVRVVSQSGDALCGVHSGEARYASVDDFADDLQARKARYFKDRGVAVRDAPRRRITLANGASGIDVTTEILSGGKSRRIYVLGGAASYHIDCEAPATIWDKFEPRFARIIDSFAADGKP